MQFVFQKISSIVISLNFMIILYIYIMKKKLMMQKNKNIDEEYKINVENEPHNDEIKIKLNKIFNQL